MEPMSRPAQSAPSRWITWLGAHELGVLLAFCGIAAGIWIFAWIADTVREGEAQTFDRTILLALRHSADLSPLGSAEIQDAVRDISALGGPVVLTLLTLISAGFLWLDGKRHLALLTCGSVWGGLLISTLLKVFFQRARPDLVPFGSYVSTTSFPSGHSMMSAVVYLTLGALLARSQPGRRLKAYFLLLAAFLTLIVGCSRVYLGVHWPTDVLAGWTAGASWATLCWLVARKLQARHQVEREGEHGNE